MVALAGMGLVGCGTPVNKAPVVDRGTFANGGATPPPAAPEVKPLPGAENAGKPGYYTVKPGDTLIRIGLDNGQSWKDIARWNNLDNANLIEVGQVLRVVPPGAPSSAVASDTGVVTRPVTSSPVAAASSAGAPKGAAPAAAAAAAPASAASAPAAAASAASSAAALARSRSA